MNASRRLGMSLHFPLLQASLHLFLRLPNCQAFQTYDATGDGSLNIEELRKALKAANLLFDNS